MRPPSVSCWQCGSSLPSDRQVAGSWCSTKCKSRWYWAKKTPEERDQFRARERERARLRRVIPDLPGEEWRPVTGYEGWYAISTMGRLKSLSRINDAGRYRPDRLVKGSLNRKGYVQTKLFKGRQKRQSTTLHRLVCSAFHGECPSPDMQVRHLNGNPADNRAENLAWGTGLENAADTKRHGRQWNLSKTHCKHGHEFTPANTYVHPNGQRVCRECDRRTSREWQRKKRAA